jgi:nitrogen fixation/metabolism regulation signal transduction histidine kinase
MAIFAPYIMALFSDLPLSQKSEAAEVLLLLHKYIWPGIGLVIILFGVLSIFITHKLAGPVFVFERMTRNIAAGDLTVRAKLRRGDDLRDLEKNFNQMADNLESLLIKLEEEHKKLSSYVSKLRRELEAREISEQTIIELTKKIDIDREDIKKILERYKYRGKAEGTLDKEDI